MNEKLTTAIIRVCQSEYIRFNPSDALVSFFLENEIGEWTGFNYRISPDDKSRLADLMLEKTGIDAFSQDVGGIKMKDKAAILHPEEQENFVTSNDPPTVQLRQYLDGKLMYGEFNGRLPDGMSLSVHPDRDQGPIVHRSILLCRTYDHFHQIDTARLDTSSMISPLVVYAGSNSQDCDSTTRFIRRLNLPVYLAADISLTSLLFASSIPLLSEILLPSDDDFAALVLHRNRHDKFMHEFHGMEKNLSGVDGPIGALWRRITEQQINISFSSLCTSPHTTEDAKPVQDVVIERPNIDPAQTKSPLPSTDEKPDGSQASGKPNLDLTPDQMALYMPKVSTETEAVFYEKQKSLQLQGSSKTSQPTLFQTHISNPPNK